MPEQDSVTVPTVEERDHSACGVGTIANIPSLKAKGVYTVASTHQIVEDGLKVLGSFDYRSGYNAVTGESDGAGIKFHGLPTSFFQKKIREGQFKSTKGIKTNLQLKAGQYALGQYFLPTTEGEKEAAKALIERNADANGLLIAGWRDLNESVDLTILSDNAREKKPAIWQAIFVPKFVALAKKDFNLESAVLKAGIDISYEARNNQVALNVVSQSSESIVYKGMIRPEEMGLFYIDLQDKDFTASGVSVHARFATNTNPQWANAQPCVFFLSHNGELNSAPANAQEMYNELQVKGFNGIYPNAKLSDSMQFDADLANQIAMKKISLAEAFVRLMPPPVSNNFSEEAKAMVKCFRLERTPYNGPAFAVASFGGYYIAKLDEVGLRPSRWAIIEDAAGNRQFHAASDDYVTPPPGGKIIKKGHLEPGGMIMVTPEGEVMDTNDVLESICTQYREKQDNQKYFQQRLQSTVFPLSQGDLESVKFEAGPDLQRKLYSAGWDHEAEAQVVRPMAEDGEERVGAMGDDTNPLYSTGLPPHISYFFHQLFAQVSAPPIDSIKERDRFTLDTTLGPRLGLSHDAKQIALKSPILGTNDLAYLEKNTHVNTVVLDTCFEIPPAGTALTTADTARLMREAIKSLVLKAEAIARQPGGGILVLSDRFMSSSKGLIPDMIAVAAVRKHLESKNLMQNVSIVADSYQITGPHQSAALLAVGANAVYARGAYAKIQELFGDSSTAKADNYQHATEKCLLKTMGKMGITDVNNYINGNLVAALGLDLSAVDDKGIDKDPTLANIFPKVYSPLKGYNLGHIANGVFVRHHQAYDEKNSFATLPRSGYYISENNGVKHGFGPVVVDAFTTWLKEEEIRAHLWQMHTILERKGYPGFLPDVDQYTTEHGFLDPREKNKGHPRGVYPIDYLERFKVSQAFRDMQVKIDQYRKENPTSITDHFNVKVMSKAALRKILGLPDKPLNPLQSKAEIRKRLYSGSMSQGALTVADVKTPDKRGAHETITEAMNAVGAMSASGEGGEAPKALRNHLTSDRSKQIASGRFGVNAMQILCAEEIEIKIAQGAKPGEGGQLNGKKVTIRIAAQRGGLPGTTFISPPPHHDIYSIEDLEQLILDIKAVNPKVKVAVKLAASVGIGTIAVGVAKAGADVINIASNSGGTAAAQQSSIKHTGLPAELALAEVDNALRKVGLRDLVKLRTSGGFKTAEDVILAAILGADLFEFGTTVMLTQGCKVQRTCNQSCQPGVATDGHLFKGDQANTERFFTNLAASIQERLEQLGVSSLDELRGRTELLALIDPKRTEHYDFSAILNRSEPAPPLKEELRQAALKQRENRLQCKKEEALIESIAAVFNNDKSAVIKIDLIHLTTQDRSFGARIAGAFAKHLEQYPKARIILKTQGNAGQSFGFVLPKGMSIHHTGPVQDGCAKSMSGGELCLVSPNQSRDYRADENTIVGNAMLYGASGGKIYVNGGAGHRFGILLKGAQVVVESVGDFAFEYMTSGTAMILGKAGKGIGTGSSGGIIFVYDEDNDIQPSDAVRTAPDFERGHYESAIKLMLKEHLEKTGSLKAKEILNNFNLSRFKVLIPNELSKIKSLQGVNDVISTYELRQAPLTPGMQVWLEQKALDILQHQSCSQAELDQLHNQLSDRALDDLFSKKMHKELLNLVKHKLAETKANNEGTGLVKRHERLHKARPVEQRVGGVNGTLDLEIKEAVEHIKAYVAELSTDGQGCSGCSQSCTGDDGVDSGCPIHKGIHAINDTLKKIGTIAESGQLTIAQWKTVRRAFELQIQESPFIAYTGAACPAPCQDGCSESNSEPSDTVARGNKKVGEPVHIKDIEYNLYHLGRALGWFDKPAYGFNPPFSKARKRQDGKELIIVGSGPAAMQIAYEALRDGLRVRMYEKSDKPGGLLADGIPAHKFDKSYLKEDFDRLKAMGLELHLKSEVTYDSVCKQYKVKGSNEVIADADNKNQAVALCVGAGKPKDLPATVTKGVKDTHKNKIIQAVDFLKAANDVAEFLNNNPQLSAEAKERLIKDKFAHMDPRGKKIVVIGGGDTAQDVIRWVARYFTEENAKGDLDVMVRGPEPVARGIQDGFPATSKAPTTENKLQAQEVSYIGGKKSYLVEPKDIFSNESGQLTVQAKQSKFKNQEQIINDQALKKLSDALPREKRPIERAEDLVYDNVDMVICALGFQGQRSIDLVLDVQKANAPQVFIAGDASGVESQIIVGAQANGKNTYYGQIRPALDIQDNSVPLSATAGGLSPLQAGSMFRPATTPSHVPHGAHSAATLAF